MKKVLLIGSMAVTLVFTGCENMQDLQPLLDMGVQLAGQQVGGLGNQAQLVSGLRDMLTLSSDRASNYLSSANVWSMVMPPEANKVVNTLRSIGMGRYVDGAEASMNKAAGQAALAAKPVFKQAIKDMTIVDALQIWQGGPSAATQYFRGKTETALRAKFQPIIQNSLQQTGYYNQYKSAMDVYNAIPFASKPSIDVESYMLNKTMDGMFNKMASEESAIRQNPAAQGTALIQSILGAVKK